MSTSYTPTIASAIAPLTGGAVFWLGWWAMTAVMTLFVISALVQLVRRPCDERP